MAHIAIIGAGIGGLPAAYDLRNALGREHSITVINATDYFQFVPSNPWIAVGWRQPDQITVPLQKPLARRGIDFIAQSVKRVHAAQNRVELGNGSNLDYDYLVITTGPKLAFDEIPGLGPEGYSQSVCTLDHAKRAWAQYQEFVKNPGPIVVGAVQGASCFGPAYEFAMILDADLRKRGIRNKVPMHFVTSEPYVGHMGLGGVGDSKSLLEHELRERHIKWITNAKVQKVDAEKLTVVEHDDNGAEKKTRELPASFSMLIPAFKGVDAVFGIEGLTNPRGFILIDKQQRNPTFRNIFSAGVCVAIPPVEVTPIPTGAPKTGYMIESMISAIVHNIKADIEGGAADAEGTWNAICLADMGDTGAAFVALPQIPPRNVTWAKKGKWVHWAKVMFEKYFLYKMRRGSSEPFYERLMLRLLGIRRLRGAKS